MPLKESYGNMYDWVSHMHTHLGGECPHKCGYCYVGRNRWGRADRYKGEPRLIEKELLVPYGEGKTIFIEHMNDMFAEGVENSWILSILQHCKQFPDNKYVFQTKNPERAFAFSDMFPKDFMIGTTIESNRHYPELSKAPEPKSRYLGISAFSVLSNVKTFITVEPVLDFDVKELLNFIIASRSSFINIGADSKGCKLPEPSPEKLKELIKGLVEYGIPIKKKINLGRLLA